MAGLDPQSITQAIGLAQGQAIKIIGGVPILKNVLGSTLEKLKLPKHLEIGNIGQILAKVQAGGIGTLLQAPLGQALSSLTGSLSAVQSSLGAISGASGLISAIGDLGSSASGLSDLASNLVGAGNIAGLPNQFDLMGHMNLAQSFGALLPTNLSLAVVTAPMTASPMLADATSQVLDIGSQVVAGSLPIANAVSAVTSLKSEIDACASSATGAISTLASTAPDLAAASSAIALMVSAPAELQAAMRAAIQPAMLPAVQALIDDHLSQIAA